MNAGTVISLARIKLRDDVGPDFQWSTLVLLQYLDDGQRQALESRPDLRLGAAGAMTTITSPTTMETALLLGEEWAQPLAAYVAFQALSCESDDPARQQAATMHYQLFMARLG